jgi:hypothetical protein
MFAEFRASLLHSRQDFFTRYSLSSVKLIQAVLNFGSNFAQEIVLFEEAKPLASHFAVSIVVPTKPGLEFRLQAVPLPTLPKLMTKITHA